MERVCPYRDEGSSHRRRAMPALRTKRSLENRAFGRRTGSRSFAANYLDRMRSAFFNIARRISDHLRRQLAEQNVSAESRRFALVCQFNGPQISLQVLLADVSDLNVGEARFFREWRQYPPVA
jgi:hypothetical protein